MKGLPPLGDRNDGQRRCSRITGRTDTGAEILCDAPAAQHVIWWWREAKPGENWDDCWDHGFCCPEHWAELTASGESNRPAASSLPSGPRPLDPGRAL